MNTEPVAGQVTPPAGAPDGSPAPSKKTPAASSGMEDLRSFTTLRLIMAALRTPGTGCPWDLEQDFASIAPYTIEEAYEVAEAIARGDRKALCEELGDLLLQPVYHAQMAAEEGSFTLDDVIEAINNKMIRRHPHVFGDSQARSAGVAKDFWETNKAKESTHRAANSALDGVALALPALTRAVKLQAKAARVGFDWPSVNEVFSKVAEEIAELKAAAPDRRAEELGDLLFAVANIGRHYGIDPETALRAANHKFEQRFAYIERELAVRGKTPAQSTLAEMDAIWNEAKSAL